MIYRGQGFNRFPTLNWEVYSVQSDNEMGFDLRLEIQRPHASLPVYALIPGEVVQAMIHLHAYKHGDVAIQDVYTAQGTWKLTDAREGVILRSADELIGLNLNEVRGLMDWLMVAQKGDEGIYFSESARGQPSTAIN